jgi:hypothetical protein
MTVPKDPQKVVGKKELRYSLKTGYLNDAKYKTRILAGQVQRLFQHLRKGGVLLSQLSDAQIQKSICFSRSCRGFEQFNFIGVKKNPYIFSREARKIKFNSRNEKEELKWEDPKKVIDRLNSPEIFEY